MPSWTDSWKKSGFKFLGTEELEWKQGVPKKPRVVPRMGTRLCLNRLRGRKGLRVSDEEDCLTKAHTGEGTSNLQQSFDGMEGENPATDSSASVYNTGNRRM